MKINISSQLCKYTHKINGKIKWEKIIVEINTPFEKSRASKCPELLPPEISGTLKRYILKTAGYIEQDCFREYLVPDADRDVCSREICSMRNQIAVAML